MRSPTGGGDRVLAAESGGCLGNDGPLYCDRNPNHGGNHYDRAVDTWWGYKKNGKLETYPRHNNWGTSAGSARMSNSTAAHGGDNGRTRGETGHA